jgi:hypothetical protein
VKATLLYVLSRRGLLIPIFRGELVSSLGAETVPVRPDSFGCQRRSLVRIARTADTTRFLRATGGGTSPRRRSAHANWSVLGSLKLGCDGSPRVAEIGDIEGGTI